MFGKNTAGMNMIVDNLVQLKPRALKTGRDECLDKYGLNFNFD